MWWSLDKTVKTVDDMYKYARTNDIPLLSSFTSFADTTNDFWHDYNIDYERYDSAFALMYKNYRFFDQDVEDENAIADVTTRFIDAVYNFLMINDKKFSQLYKVEKYNTTANLGTDYDITETKTANRTSEYVSGQRSDSVTSGQRTDIQTEQTMAFNSSTFVDSGKVTDEKGAETDTSIKGSQTDTEDRDETHTIRTVGSKTDPSINIDKFIETWDSFSFYKYIFEQICKELLLV